MAKSLMCAAVLAATLLAGCLTREQIVAQRIAAKQEFFNTLPAEEQERLRAGKLRSGDSVEAAWIIYGDPDRRFTRVEGSVTNEIWSYADYEIERFDHPRAAYHPVRGAGGRMIWQSGYIWRSDTTYHVYEYLRIEFEENRVKRFEEEKP